MLWICWESRLSLLSLVLAGQWSDCCPFSVLGKQPIWMAGVAEFERFVVCVCVHTCLSVCVCVCMWAVWCSGCVLGSGHEIPSSSLTLAIFHLPPTRPTSPPHDWDLAWCKFKAFSHETTMVQVGHWVPTPLAVRKGLFSCEFLAWLQELCLHGSQCLLSAVNITARRCKRICKCVCLLECVYVCLQCGWLEVSAHTDGHLLKQDRLWALVAMQKRSKPKSCLKDQKLFPEKI